MPFVKFTLIAICIAFIPVDGEDVLVDVEQGTLLGQTETFMENKFINKSMTINVFKGVPYAERPVRFTAPEPKQKWEGVYNATEFSDQCPQFIYPYFYVPSNKSEDCLYLNVFAPSDLTGEHVPVMVFIHGGGFTAGTSMTYDYYGNPLVAVGNVVVVTINYRLSAIGFLDTGDDASPGNFGLLDQVEALRWIKNNIEAFGGDSSQITIFGESAGAASVDFHVISKKSRDLFDQAITESGSSTSPWSYMEATNSMKVQQAFALGDLFSCNTRNSYELVDCLRKIDAQELEAAVGTNFIRMGPTIDGVFLEESPLVMTERGDFKNCPIMTGINKDEGSMFHLYDLNNFYREEPPSINKTSFDMLVTTTIFINNYVSPKIVEDAAKQQYVPWGHADKPDLDYFETINTIYGDEAFTCPVVKTARAHAMTSEPVYLYFMTVVPTRSVWRRYDVGPDWFGAAHAEELQFVFGFPFIPEIQEQHGQMSDPEKELSVKFMTFWTNFAKSGDPSKSDPSSSPGVGEWAWPAFTIPELQYKELSYEMNINRGLKADECAFWNQFEPDLQIFTASMDQTEKEWREEFSGWQDDLEQWRMAFADYQSDPSCQT